MIPKQTIIVRKSLIRRLIAISIVIILIIKFENISLSQQTYITNNITETNTETINYADINYWNIDKIATVIVNPAPSPTENYWWIPETTDNVVPGLDSLLPCPQSKYATVAALQNSIPNINNTISNEIQRVQTEII